PADRRGLALRDHAAAAEDPPRRDDRAMSAAVQMRAHAPCLMVSDVLKAHSYYSDRLGFRSPRMWGDPPTFCIAQRDGLELMLAQVDPGKTGHPNAENDGRIDAYVWLNDGDARQRECSDRGAGV